MLRLRFQGCSPDYIQTVCHGRCCTVKTSPTGPVVYVERDQQQVLRRHGAKFDAAGLLQTVNSRCTFHGANGLCGAHDTGAKPRSCIQSPFMLTAKDTLIVRNRYRRLCCFKAAPAVPAYRAFNTSLVLLFGVATAERIARHLDAGGGDLITGMLRDRYEFAKHVAPSVAASTKPRALG